MSLANARDIELDENGTEVWYRQWPATRGGDVDENGTVRPMTAAELAQWDAVAQQDQDQSDLSAWLALKPDFIAGRDLVALGGGPLSNADLSNAVREHRQLLRKLCRGQLRLMRQYE